MKSDLTTITTQFEGVLPLWLVILMGGLLIGMAVWMARRDVRVTDRPKFVWGLFALRVGAVLVLLWMLAGPTRVTTLRSFKQKAIALFVDTSASMGLVDGVDGSGNVSRWAAARQDQEANRLLREIDANLARIHAGLTQLRRFSEIPDATPRADGARQLLAQAVAGLSAGIDGMQTVALRLPAGANEIKRGLLAATQEMESAVMRSLREQQAEFGRGRTLLALDRSRWLPEALGVLGVAAAQMTRWSDQWTQQLEASEVQTAGAFTTAESKLSRLDKVESFLAGAEESWLKELRAKAAVTTFEFGDRVVPKGNEIWKKTVEPTGRVLGGATHLGAAMQQLALDHSGRPLEAAILITDGGQNGGTDPRELAASLKGTTLHVVPIGNTKMQRDVILHHTHAPRVVLQNDQVVVDSVITAYDCAKETLQIELLANEVVVDRQTLPVANEVFDSRVQLRWKAAKLGKHRLSFRVKPVAEERTTENNLARMDVQVMEDKIRVLVADNFPRWETRYLINLFKRDERIEFDQLLFEPQRMRGPGVRAAFPTSLEEWARYRVVILGDLLPSQLTAVQQKLLRDYVVEAGGNLILLAGDEAMPAAYVDQPLGGLLPVEADGAVAARNQPFYLHLTDELSLPLAVQIAEGVGASERVWREMSQRLPIYALSKFSKPKPTANALLWASPNKTTFQPGDRSTRGFLTWHYVGAGRVIFLAAPVTYQLRYRQGDLFHHRFWGQLLRWAVARDLAEGSTTVRLSTDKSRYEQGEPVEVSVRLRQLDGRPVGGAALRVEASQEKVPVVEVDLKEEVGRPGNYRALLQQLPVGPVKLKVTGDRIKELLAAENYKRDIETTITMDPSGQLELRHPLANMALLWELADASAGMVVPPTGLEAAMRQLNLEPEVLENIQKKPLWNRWDLFWIFLGGLGLEWAGRKYAGLS